MTAEAQLERLLWLIPAASGVDGSPLEDLAAAMEASVDDVMRDVEALTARAFYHPAGSADDLQVLVDENRLYIWTGGELQRPGRLTVREALALGVGLRAAALKHGGSRAGRMLRLARRLEQELAGVDVSELDRVHEVDLGEDLAGVRPVLEAAARDRRALDIEYLKAGAEAPEQRRVLPYALVHAEGAWYLLGESSGAESGERERRAESGERERRAESGERERRTGAAARDSWREHMRAFRVDRVLAATELDDTFVVPADFDVEEHLTGARVYRPNAEAEEVDVEVRYAPAVARWIRERVATDPSWAARLAEEDGGSVVATHRVADAAWLIGHVLQYGTDAEVLSPPDVRARVAEVAARIATAG